jgi:hypothetical protein
MSDRVNSKKPKRETLYCWEEKQEVYRRNMKTLEAARDLLSA